MHERFRSIGIFLIVALLLLSSLPVTAYATPHAHVNTGDQRADIIAVAKTQLGYLEGAGNDTKYGVWFGHNRLGWCGIFVTWCARQAGVPTSVLAHTGIPNPATYGLTT